MSCRCRRRRSRCCWSTFSSCRFQRW